MSAPRPSRGNRWYLASGWQAEVFRLAFASLVSHKMRGALTILAIVIGITSVVGMVSMVEGMNKTLEEQIGSLGSDVIRIRRWEAGVFVGEIPDSLRKRKKFTERDAEGIRETCPSVLAVSVMNRTQQRLRYGSEESRYTEIFGIDPYYLLVRGLKVKDGRPMTETEVRTGTRTVMIGADIEKQLFTGVDPVGQQMQIGIQKFDVVGVLESRGSFLGQSLDNLVLIPRSAYRRYFGTPRERLYLWARPERSDLLPQALEEITESLRRTRGLRPQDPNDFALNTQDNLLDLWNQLTGAFFIVIVAIASVALLVGGVGVMNIMLVGVTERTREIGIRKALGATRSQILGQFLAEAMVLTGAGGVLGILIGVVVGKVVQAVTPLPSFVPIWAYVVAFAVSVGVGLFFGMWPAVRAARLDPVDALRYE